MQLISAHVQDFEAGCSRPAVEPTAASMRGIAITDGEVLGKIEGIGEVEFGA